MLSWVEKKNKGTRVRESTGKRTAEIMDGGCIAFDGKTRIRQHIGVRFELFALF